MSKDSIGYRAFMTFIEGFFCVLIPEVVVLLTNVLEYDWKQWPTFVVPIVCGAIASGISAAWNTIRGWIQAKTK